MSLWFSWMLFFSVPFYLHIQSRNSHQITRHISLFGVKFILATSIAPLTRFAHQLCISYVNFGMTKTIPINSHIMYACIRFFVLEPLLMWLLYQGISREIKFVYLWRMYSSKINGNKSHLHGMKVNLSNLTLWVEKKELKSIGFALINPSTMSKTL